MPGAGFEPARPFGQWILSPPRLPFRHPGLPTLSWDLGVRRVTDRSALQARHRGAWYPAGSRDPAVRGSVSAPARQDPVHPGSTVPDARDEIHGAKLRIWETNVDERELAIRTVERTIEASAALREHLASSERTGRKMISALRRGVPISRSVEVTGASPSELRQSSYDLIAQYELCRHEMRAAFLLPSLDEGMSIGDIGRALGISRQLASRLVKEARDTSPLVSR